MITYEQRLNESWDLACQEGDRYFARQSATHVALRKIAQRLEEAQIPYALIGALAMFFHGFRRFTEDVDLLVTSEGRIAIHKQLVGPEYVPSFPGSKHIRDAESGVRIDLRAGGDFRGDGMQEPIVVPQPSGSTIQIAGIRVLQLPKLVELKLASGMSGGVVRLKDHADVIAMIQKLRLTMEFAEQLQRTVRDKYEELWTAVRDAPRPE